MAEVVISIIHSKDFPNDIGAHPILTLNISVTNSCKLHWSIVKELSFLSSSVKEKL